MSEALDELAEEVIKESLEAGDIESAVDLAIMKILGREEGEPK